MTEKANPSINRPIEAFNTAGAIAYGGSEEGFIVDGADPTPISVSDLGITESNLNAFDETSDGSSLDVTIDAGEAFVFGSWVAIDTTTTVSLNASTAGQTVYVGWNKDGADDVIVGLESAFETATGSADQKLPLWDFDTDASGVTSVTDRRDFNRVSLDSIAQGDGSGLDADTVDGIEAADLGSDVSNDGSTVTTSATDIDFTTGLVAVDDGDNTSTITFDESAQYTFTQKQTFDAGIGGLPEPIQDNDAARKVYVDSVAEGLDIKSSVIAASDDTNIDLASSADPNPLDGVTLSDGDRVLLKDQTDSTENGIYVASTATNPTTWARSPDADEDAEVSSGMFVFVQQGTSNEGQGFVVVTQDPITLGTTAIEFTQFSGAESFSAGVGLVRSDNTISHDDTSTQTDIVSADGAAVTDLTFDDFGHITAATTTSFEGRYLNTSGDSMAGDLDVDGNAILDGAATVWDPINGYIPQTSLQNDSLTLTAGDGLKGAGTIALGSSDTISAEPADFAGSFLEDDGSDNLDVQIGFGLTDDGSGNISVDDGPGSGIDADTIDGAQKSDLDGQYVNVSGDTLSGDLNLNTNDIVDGATVVWDGTNGYVPQTSLEYDSITIGAGDGLKDGGSVALDGAITLNIEPSDFAGTYLSDDGNDNLRVDIGFGLTDDGSGNISVDQTDLDPRYVNASGDTMTGDLTISGALFADQSTGNLDIAGTLTENASI
jgi:hypothetical protein